MIAPEPFFEPRGTPFSEFHRIRALTALGHEVDLVTYPFGETVAMPGLRIFRSLKPPFLRGVKIGPSVAKLPLDALLACTALRRALSSRYDAVHSHEEAGFIGVLLAAWLRVPHLYDMHSSLPQQLTNFKFTKSRFLIGAFKWLEDNALRAADAVITICPDLRDYALSTGLSGDRHLLIENSIFDDVRLKKKAAATSGGANVALCRFELRFRLRSGGVARFHPRRPAAAVDRYADR